MEISGLRRARALAAGLLSGLVCGACSSSGGEPWVSAPAAGQPADVTVLMMGNSHTSAHDLPQQLDAMLRAGLPGRTVATAVAPGWLFLDERLADAPSMQLLASRPWRVVVLQAQKYSSSGQFSHSTSEAVALVRHARSVGALPVLFPEWARRGVAETRRIHELHLSIARAEPACVAPVGQAWDLAAQRFPALELHAADGNHAAPAGAYLAALVLYATVTGASPLSLPDQANGVAPTVQAQLRQVAADAAQATPPRQFCPADRPLGAASPELNAAMEALWQQNPQHLGAAYVAARSAARAGDAGLALRWLDRLLASGLGDQLDPDDFAAITALPAYRQRAAAFAAAAPAAGSPQRVQETTCADLLPEGTAWDARRRRLLVSSGRQRTVFALDATGACRPLVPSADGGLLAVLGMAVQADSDSLWVASAAAPFMVAPQPDETGTALLARIDLQQGRVVQTWRLPGTGLLNDLTLAADGSVYVTESRGGTVYRLGPARGELEPVFPAGSFEGPNGIVALDAGHLVVADFHGLWLVSGASTPQPSRQQLQSTPGPAYLGGFDGLAKAGAHIVGIQNLVGLSRVWWLRLDLASASVQPFLLLRGHADLRNPTTGAVADGQFHFIADPNLQTWRADGSVSPLPPQRKGHRLLSLALPEDR